MNTKRQNFYQFDLLAFDFVWSSIGLINLTPLGGFLDALLLNFSFFRGFVLSFVNLDYIFCRVNLLLNCSPDTHILFIFVKVGLKIRQVWVMCDLQEPKRVVICNSNLLSGGSLLAFLIRNPQ